MEGVPFGEHIVFLYDSILFTRSPLLKEIYCESHRCEPWAVLGEARRVGHYVAPNVLYVEARIREALLDEIPRQLERGSGWVGAVIDRHRAAARDLTRSLLALQAGDRSGVARLIDATERVLSSGVFKERMEPEHALDLLGAYLPIDAVRPHLFALYQPLCLPHFLKFELKMLFFAERLARTGDHSWVGRCIEQAAYLSRFFVEETELDDAAAMRRSLEEISESHGGPDRIASKRRELIANHGLAVASSLWAERDILETMDRAGRYTLRSKHVVMDCLRLIQFVATFEELKHIFTVRVARALKGLLDDLDLRVDETDVAALFRAL